MTGWQIAAFAGALIALGVVGLVWYLVPAEPDLADALDRLSSERAGQTTTGTVSVASGSERLGVWAVRHLPSVVWGQLPARDLALLRIPAARFYGEKVTFFLIGLASTPVLVWVYGLSGMRPPLPATIGGSIAVGALMWFLPDLNVRRDAAEAREDFSRAIGAYTELVAMERQAGSGARQSLEIAAGVGDSWVFRRIAEQLAHSGWSGQPAWDALHTLADKLGLPALDDLGDIMRLGGEEGAQVYRTLRARSAALRTQMRTSAQARANSMAEKMTLPGLVMGLIFTVILVGPSLAALFITP